MFEKRSHVERSRDVNDENGVQSLYKLSEEQNTAINEARLQIKNGDYLTNEQADREIEEWLNKCFYQLIRLPLK